MIPQPQEKPNKHALSSDFIELTPASTYGDTLDVGGKHQQTAKFRDCHSLSRRQYRHHLAGGFLLSVECEHGFMPGIRRIQDGENRSTRMVRFRLSHDSTRQILPNVKTQLGAVAMTAIKPMGNPARRAPAHLAIGGAAV